MQVLLFKLKYVVHMREDLVNVYLRHVHKTDWAKEKNNHEIFPMAWLES